MERKHNMQFEVGADGKSVHVKRQYDAPLDQVWQAWTDASILDQWWAPAPWQCQTKQHQFTEGGHWLYAMVGPEGEHMWSICSYEEIEPLSYFEGADSFCDENGVVNSDFGTVHWRTEFSENEIGTLVENKLSDNTPKHIQQLLEMGFKEGFEMGLNNLEKWLAEHGGK